MGRGQEKSTLTSFEKRARWSSCTQGGEPHPVLGRPSAQGERGTQGCAVPSSCPLRNTGSRWLNRGPHQAQPWPPCHGSHGASAESVKRGPCPQAPFGAALPALWLCPGLPRPGPEVGDRWKKTRKVKSRRRTPPSARDPPGTEVTPGRSCAEPSGACGIPGPRSGQVGEDAEGPEVPPRPRGPSSAPAHQFWPLGTLGL